MKQKQYNETSYNFTIKELQVMLGYTSNSQNYNLSRAIVECIQTLKAESYIDYDLVYVETDKSAKGQYKIPNYQLTFITDKLPKAIQEVKKAESAETASKSSKLDKRFNF